MPGLLHVALLRSPMAHARVTRVDVSAALARPGVVAAYTGADLADDMGGLPTAWTVSEDMKTPPHLPLTQDKVRYVGDAVAVVVATSRYAAADALEAVEVDYEPLPAVLDMEAALADGSPLVHDDIGTNLCFTYDEEHGDYEAAKAKADVVLRRRYINQRLIPSAMEPRAVVVDPTAGVDSYTIWSATQVPHFVRVFMSLVTGIPEHKIRVIAPDVGGGFGSKLDIYAEEAICLALAQKLGAAGEVDRVPQREHPGDHPRPRPDPGRRDRGHGRRPDARAADRPARRHGRLPAAPHAGHPAARPLHVPGDLQVRVALASTARACSPTRRRPTPTAAPAGRRRRSPSNGPSTTWPPSWASTRSSCAASNWITHERVPVHDGLRAGPTTPATTRRRPHGRWSCWTTTGCGPSRPAGASRGDPVQLGIGMSTYTEMCGLAPSPLARREGVRRRRLGARHGADAPPGKAEVVAGTSPHGQGHVTDVQPDRRGRPRRARSTTSRSSYSDTAAVPWGLDTYGSRSLAVGGIADPQAGASGWSRRPSCSPPTCSRPTPATWSSTPAPSGSRAPRRPTKTIQEVAFAAFAAHSMPDGQSTPILHGRPT